MKKLPTSSDIVNQTFVNSQQQATEKDVTVKICRGHTEMVWRVALSVDGTFAITTSSDGTLRKWQLARKKIESEVIFTLEQMFLGVALDSENTLAAVGDFEGNIYMVDIFSEKLVRSWKAHPSFIGNLAFIEDGRELLSASQGSYLRKWNVKSGKRLTQCKSPFEFCFGVAASTDGKTIVGSAIREGLISWSGSSEPFSKIFRENIGNHSPVCLTADGNIAFTGTEDGKVILWNIEENRKISAFEGHAGEVQAIATTPDGQICVSAGADKTIRIWAARSGECLAILRGHRKPILGISITPDARRIATTSADKTLRIWDIPDSILNLASISKKRGYLNAKVVLLGDSGVGKSGLAIRLWHNRWEKTESSHGMEVRRLEMPPTGEEGIEREVWLWDLAGQPDYRLTHQLFMEQTTLAILVFDPQDSRFFETITYWQDALKRVVRNGNLAGILVAARCDRPGLRLTIEEIRDWASRRGLHGPILTAAKTEDDSGTEELRSLVAELLPWDTLEFRSTVENFRGLKDAILAIRDSSGTGGIVVKPVELEERVRTAAPNLKFTKEDLYAVTGLLAGEGVIYALPYGNLIVLQPSWMNCYASTLVKLAGEAENQLGHVPMAIIQPGRLPDDKTPRLSPEDERQLLPALVALFLERALAWTQQTDKGPMLVFPNYVRLPRQDPPPRPGRTVVYQFTGPLEEIYCTLVVRLHYSGLFSALKLYRQAVDFSTATDKVAALTMDERGNVGELEIYFGAELDSDLQASFQQFIHDHLTNKALELKRLRNYFCPKCKEEATDRKAIDAALQKSRSKIICSYCDPDSPGMIILKDVLERQFTSKKGEEGADEAEVKAGKGISTASMEQVMVGEVMTIVASANQAFIPRVVRDEGTDGDIEFYNTSGHSTGLTYRVQLKSGDSHLKKLKNGSEKFSMKRHYERYWAGRGTIPVLLIVRDSIGTMRYMNATKAILAAQKQSPGKPVRSITFLGKTFSLESVTTLRDERLKSAKRLR